jgi:hypothetical protein
MRNLHDVVPSLCSLGAEQAVSKTRASILSKKRSHNSKILIYYHVSVPNLASEKPCRPGLIKRHQLQYPIQENIHIMCRRLVSSGRRFSSYHALRLLTPFMAYTDVEPLLLQRSEIDESSTFLGKSWASVLRWMHDCLRNHPRCNEWSTSQWWPTRLLDVESHAEARLLETSAATPSGPYLTLSYR